LARASEAAGHAQLALDRAATVAVEEAVARAEAACAEAEEAEGRAASAAAIATAHEEVSAGQAMAAEQVSQCATRSLWDREGICNPFNEVRTCARKRESML
jgi:hypothetical protein